MVLEPLHTTILFREKHTEGCVFICAESSTFVRKMSSCFTALVAPVFTPSLDLAYENPVPTGESTNMMLLTCETTQLYCSQTKNPRFRGAEAHMLREMALLWRTEGTHLGPCLRSVEQSGESISVALGIKL